MTRLAVLLLALTAGCTTPAPVEIGDAITRPPIAVDPNGAGQ